LCAPGMLTPRRGPQASNWRSNNAQVRRHERSATAFLHRSLRKESKQEKLQSDDCNVKAIATSIVYVHLTSAGAMHAIHDCGLFFGLAATQTMAAAMQQSRALKRLTRGPLARRRLDLHPLLPWVLLRVHRPCPMTPCRTDTWREPVD
jgi:hypothetical protein